MTFQMILTLDERKVRERYDEYVRDYEWYVVNEPETLTKSPPSSEYAAGGPISFERFCSGWLDGILSDLGSTVSQYFTVERKGT